MRHQAACTLCLLFVRCVEAGQGRHVFLFYGTCCGAGCTLRKWSLEFFSFICTFSGTLAGHMKNVATIQTWPGRCKETGQVHFRVHFSFLKVLHKIVGISPLSIFLSIFNMFHVRLPGNIRGGGRPLFPLWACYRHTVYSIIQQAHWSGDELAHKKQAVGWSVVAKPCALSQWRKWKTRRLWGSRCQSWSFPRAAVTISQVTEPNMHQLIGVLWHNKQQSLIISQH